MEHCYGCQSVMEVINMLTNSHFDTELYDNPEKCYLIKINHQKSLPYNIYLHGILHIGYKNENRITHLSAKLPRDHEFLSFLEKERESMFYGPFVYYMRPTYAARCYSIIRKNNITKQPILLTEDLTATGHRQQEDKMDLDHLKISIEILAQFHADTYICQQELPECYIYMSNKLTQLTNFESKKRVETIFISAMSKWTGVSNYLKEKIKKKINEMNYVQRKPFSTIIHGRFINSKVMFDYDNNDEMSDAKIIGWNAMTVDSPGVDFARMLLSNLPDENNVSKLVAFSHKILRFYMNTLQKECPFLMDRVYFEQNIIFSLSYTFMNHFFTMKNYRPILHMINRMGGFDLDELLTIPN